MDLIYIANSTAKQAYPHTENKPLSLMKILGAAAISHNLATAAEFCDKLIVAVGFKSALIREHLGSKFNGKDIVYVEVMPDDPIAAAVKACSKFCRDELLILSDKHIYSPADVKNIAANPGSRLICEDGDCGAYSFDDDGDEKIFSNGFDAAASKLKTRGITDYCLPLRYPWHILEANVFLLRRFEGFANKGDVSPNAVIKGDVYIARGTVVKDFCRIEGPAFIDEDCELGPFTYIRKDTVIGKGVQLGRMEVYDTVLMDGFTSKHYSYAGHSVIGAGGNFGAGTITSDFRHDGKNHTTIINGKKVDAGRRKLGAFLGDNVHTGIGTLIYPGRKIAPGGSTLPGEIVKADK